MEVNLRIPPRFPRPDPVQRNLRIPPVPRSRRSGGIGNDRRLHFPTGPRTSGHLLSARATASGSRSMTVSRTRAARSGIRRPCSHSCTARASSPNRSANFWRLNFIRFRSVKNALCGGIWSTMRDDIPAVLKGLQHLYKEKQEELFMHGEAFFQGPTAGSSGDGDVADSSLGSSQAGAGLRFRPPAQSRDHHETAGDAGPQRLRRQDVTSFRQLSTSCR